MKTSKFFEFGFATKRELNDAVNALKVIDGEVNTYADLPTPANHNGEIWIVKTTTGVIFVNKKVAGLYVSNGTTWTIITPVEIDGYQKLITTPTDGNVVITDANGQTQNGNKKLDDLEEVLSYNNFASFPITGNINKIYIAKDTNTIYRWNGTQYVVISSSLVLGETSSTAYRGDRGKIAYDHSQIILGNPHNTSKSDVGLGNVDNTSDANKPISSATQSALDLKQNTIPDGAKINIVGSDVASASTVNLDNATGDIITITGTTTITAITLSAGIKRVVRFAGTLTLTNSANLVLPTSANITTTSGDYATFIGFAGGVVRCTSYSKANGTPLAINGGVGLLSYLTLNSSLTTAVSNYAYFALSGTNATSGYFAGTDNIPLSINAAYRVKASEFDATSDIRIKDIIGISNSTEDLETLNKIEITNYYFKDKRQGIKPIKKVIGQQLQKIYPQAVNQTTDFVPDIMKMSEKIIDNKIYLKNHTLKKGDIVRIIAQDKELDCEVLFVDENYFVVNNVFDNQVFVYGKQVNDFLLVDYDALITLAISAIQEIYKKIK